MAGEFSGGFRPGIVALVAGIAKFFSGMPGITAKALLRNVAYLRDQTVALETTHVGVFWKLGGALASALQTFATYVRDHAKTFLKWAGDKLRKLEQYLKTKFGPILRFLKTLKDHINDIYKRFVRPIIDTIEFIRQLNRVLNVLHIHVFDKLDRTLQQIEQRIEAPFLWTLARITELQNWVDRIVTLDGLFQRITLIQSLAAYAPDWLKLFWDKQAKGIAPALRDQMRAMDFPVVDPGTYGRELGDYLTDRPSEIEGLADELVPMWLEASRGASA
jgi:AcrR family transcriptional regulator